MSSATMANAPKKQTTASMLDAMQASFSTGADAKAAAHALWRDGAIRRVMVLAAFALAIVPALMAIKAMNADGREAPLSRLVEQSVVLPTAERGL